MHQLQKSDLIHVEGGRGRGRPIVTWDEVVRKDLISLHFLEVWPKHRGIEEKDSCIPLLTISIKT